MTEHAPEPQGTGRSATGPDPTGASFVGDTDEDRDAAHRTGRPTPTEERNSREEGQPPKTTHDGDRELAPADAPDTPRFGDGPEALGSEDAPAGPRPEAAGPG